MSEKSYDDNIVVTTTMIKSAKGMGCGRPGYITCSICSATKYYSHVQRRFGQFSCEPCSKFMKRFLRDPKKFTCYEAGNCLIGRPSGEQEPRGVSVSRCKACWLKICLDKFVLDPSTKEAIFEHYLPLFVNGKGGAECPGPTAASIHGSFSSSNGGFSPLPGFHQFLPSPSSSSPGLSNSHSSTASLGSCSSPLPPPPPLPLPQRKRKTKDPSTGTSSPFFIVALTGFDSSSLPASLDASSNTSSPLREILSSPSCTSTPNLIKSRSPRKGPTSVKYKKVESKYPGQTVSSGRGSRGRGGGGSSRGSKGAKSSGGKFGVNDSLYAQSSEGSFKSLPSSAGIVDCIGRKDVDDGDENHSSAFSVNFSPRSGRVNTVELLENEPRAKFIPIKGRRGRKGKGYLHGFGYNHDHDYESLPVQLLEEDGICEEDNFDDNIVIIKTEDPLPSHNVKSSSVVLRESNEDHSEMRGRGGSFSLHCQLPGTPFRNRSTECPESPKAGTRAEDTLTDIDPNFYSTSIDLITTTEEVMMDAAKEFNHSLPATLSVGINVNNANVVSGRKGTKRKKVTTTTGAPVRNRSRKNPTTSLSRPPSTGKRGLNQENEKYNKSSKKRKLAIPHNSSIGTSSSSSHYANDSTFVRSEDYTDFMSSFDHNLTSSSSSLAQSIPSSKHNHNHHHNHSHYHSTSRSRGIDQDTEEEEDDLTREDDDEGYDGYFDRETIETRDSLFFDEILNTNSPFL